MSQITQQPILYDWSGKIVSTASAPCTNRPGTALTSPQGGIMALGSDYASTPAAQLPKVDASGNLYTISASSTLDSSGALLTSLAMFPAFTCIAPQVALATNASLLAIMNGSTSVLRLVDLYVTNASTGGLLNSGSTFVTLEIHRITAATASGTSITPMAHDTNDTLASGIKVTSLNTGITELSTAALKRFYMSNGGVAPGASTAEANAVVLQQQLPYVGRNDIAAKLIICRPNQGIHLKAVSTVTAGAFDITAVFTQAST